MGRAPCCAKVGLRKGAWTPQEDDLLIKYIMEHGEGQWRSLPLRAGLLRCGKSCRLRWRNYLKPGIKRGSITPDEEELMIRMHKLVGNRWSLIAARLGRTDNEIKNHWNTHISKKLKSQGIDHPTSQRQKRESMKLKKVSNKLIKNSSKNSAKNQQKTKANFEPDEQKSIKVEPLLQKRENHCSDESNPVSIMGSCSQENEEGLGYHTEAADGFAWPSLEGGYIDSVACFLSSDNEFNNNNIISSFKLESESIVPMADLEKLKEEYLQILKGEDH